MNFVPRWEPHGSSGEWPDVDIFRAFEGQLGVEKRVDFHIQVGKVALISLHTSWLVSIRICLNCLAGGSEEVGLSSGASNPS